MNEKEMMEELRAFPQDQEVSEAAKRRFSKALRQRQQVKQEKHHRNVCGPLSVGVACVAAIVIALLIFLPYSGHFPGHPSNEGHSLVLKAGSGGDRQWWKKAKEHVEAPSGKTLSGFVIAIMKREFGVMGSGQTPIDQYFETGKSQLKKVLLKRGYQLSSPSASEAYVTDKKKDSTGITYDLKMILTDSVPADRFKGTITVHIDGETHKIDQLTAGQVQNTNADQATNNQISSAGPDPLLDGVKMITPKMGWAVDRSGGSHKVRLLKTMDGGHHWKQIWASPTNEIRVVFKLVDQNTVWVAATRENQVILHRTTDGGDTWHDSVAAQLDHRQLLSPVSLDVHGQQAWLVVSPGHGMNSSPGTLFHSTDGGRTWKQVASTEKGNLPFGGLIQFHNGKDGWISGVSVSPWKKKYTFYRTTDGGQSWEKQKLPAPKGIKKDEKLGVALPKFFHDHPKEGVLYGSFIPKSFLAKDTRTVVYSTDDGGNRWNIVKVFPEFHVFTAIDSSHWMIWHSKTYDSNYTGAIQGEFYRTNDGGQHWQTIQPSGDLKQALQKGYDVSDLNFLDPNIGWALAASHGHKQTMLLKTEDGGKTWHAVNISGLAAKFAWKGKVFRIEGNRTPADKIGKQIGSIQQVGETIEQNGDAQILNDTMNLTAGSKIYSIQGVSKETVVAVKINGIYYTAVFGHRLR